MAVSDRKLPPFKIISAPVPMAQLTSNAVATIWGPADPEIRGAPLWLGNTSTIRLKLEFLAAGIVGETDGLILRASWWNYGQSDIQGASADSFGIVLLRMGPSYMGGWQNVGNGVQIKLQLTGVAADGNTWAVNWYGTRRVPDRWAEVNLASDKLGNPRVIFQDAAKVGRSFRDLGGSLRQITRFHPVVGTFPRPPIKGIQRGNLNLLAGFRHPVCFMPDYDDSTLSSAVLDRTIQPLVGSMGAFSGDDTGKDSYVADRTRETRRGWAIPNYNTTLPATLPKEAGSVPRFSPGLVGYALQVGPMRVNFANPSSPYDASNLGWAKLGAGGVVSLVASPDCPEVGTPGYVRYSGEASSGDGLAFDLNTSGMSGATWVVCFWMRGSMNGGNLELRMKNCTGSASTLTIAGTDMTREWTRYTLHGHAGGGGVGNIIIEVEKLGGPELLLDVAGVLGSYCGFLLDTEDYGSPTPLIPTTWLGAVATGVGQGVSQVCPLRSDRGTMAAVVTWDGAIRNGLKSVGTDNSILAAMAGETSGVGLKIVQLPDKIQLMSNSGAVLLESGTITKDHGDWYSVAVTWAANSSSPIKWTAVLYVDGVAVDTDTNVTEIPNPDAYDGLVGDFLQVGNQAGVGLNVPEILVQAMRGDPRAWTQEEIEQWHNSWFTQAGQEIRRYSNNRFFLTSARFQPADAAGVFLDGPMELTAAGGVGRHRSNYGLVREVISNKDPDGVRW